MARPKPDPDTGRTVLVRRADGETFYVTAEVAAAIESQGGEILDGAVSAKADPKEAVAKATEPLVARIAELEEQVAARDELLTLVPGETRDQLHVLAAGVDANPANKE